MAASAAFAQAQNGTVAGAVFDAQTGRPVSGVTLALNGQSSDQQITGTDGRFTISVAPGKYTIKFSSPNYAEFEVTDVEVTAGQVAEASAVITAKTSVTTIDVVEKATAVGASAEAMLQERKLSAVVSDGLSRQELSNGTSSDAAGALEKVTGVSVAGDGFVFVRGLGERYSSTQLNGAMIPTTEPEKRVVPLDLFPAGLIENIKISKTYSPDLPAEFAGGLVQLQTVDFPTSKVFTVSMKSGFNTATTFNRFLNYPGGSYDFFGFDDGTRGIPSAVPADRRLFTGSFSQTEFQNFGRAFSNNWEPTATGSMRPAFDWSAVAGGTFGRFGLVGALTFGNKPQYQNEYQRFIRQGAGSPIVFTDYPNFNEYNQQARLGGVFNVAVKLTPSQHLRFRNTLTRDAEKSAREFGGRDGGLDGFIQAQRLRYVERSMLATGVEGDHSFASLKNSLIHWQFTYSSSGRNEPDLREIVRGQLPDGRYVFSALGSSGIRFFSDLNDQIWEPQADFSIPFFKSGISGLWKTGFRVTARRRDFQARRFRYIPQRTSTLNLFLPGNQLFGPGNIRPDGFQIVEFTRGTDRYDASMNVYAGYSMVDLAIGAKWRIVGGIRVEDADQIVTTIDNLVPGQRPVVATLRNRDPIPSVNLIHALSGKTNLRFSYSRTLSRPDFRELSPFDFNNTLGGFVTQGNPNLRRASINNYDARWETFAGGNQVIAVSFFVKTFTDPIEQTVLPSNDLRQSFVNAKGARNFGFELEFRRSLRFLSARMREFSVSSNFTFVDSNISINPADATLLTSRERPLLGQSRYIGNAILEWQRPSWRSNSRFYVNRVSRRVSDVGTFGVPDIYQEGNTAVDFVYQYTFDEKGKWTARFEAENLTNNKFRWTQGTFDQRGYQLGRTFQIGLTYSIF